MRTTYCLNCHAGVDVKFMDNLDDYDWVSNTVMIYTQPCRSCGLVSVLELEINMGWSHRTTLEQDENKGWEIQHLGIQFIKTDSQEDDSE